MLALRDRTLQTRVVSIAGEEGKHAGLAGKGGIGAIVISDRLEARDAAYGLGGTWSMGIG